MLSSALEQTDTPALAPCEPVRLVKTIRQDPQRVVGGKLRVHFRTTDLGGAPEALRLGDTIYSVARRATQAIQRDGKPATAIHYEVGLPPFTGPGAYPAELRVGATWRPLTLFVLIALH